MYCRKCGKQIDYDSDFCYECQGIPNPAYGYTPIYTQPQPVEQAGSLMTGFKKALTGAILGTVAMIISLAVFFVMVIGAVEIEETGRTEVLPISIILFLGSIAMSIVGLVMGIQSIKCFIAEKRAARKKPFPTLGVGIEAISVAAFTLFWSIYNFIMLIALMAMSV